MATRAPKKPTLKKVPNAPKANASMDVWKAYENKLKAIKAENDKKMAKYNAEMKKYEAVKKAKEAIRAKAAKIRANV